MLNDWKAIFDHMEPHTLTFPAPYDKLNPFERIIVLRCMRPDKVVPAVQQFVEGEKSSCKNTSHRCLHIYQEEFMHAIF